VIPAKPDAPVSALAVGVASSRLALSDLVELVKPRIMVMALLTAAGAMSLAPGQPNTSAVLWLLAGTALIVGAANTLNMYIERDIACLMTRTKNRPLPQKRMNANIALLYGITLGLVSLPILAHVNLVTAGLGLLALFSYVLVYTPLKQRTHWATWIGALPGALPVLMGWSAATGTVDIGGLSVFAILFVWQIPHFHAIALYRQREYENAGLKTLPGSRGQRAALREIGLYMVVQVAVSLSLYPLGVAGVTYLLVASVLGIGVLVQCFAGIRNADTKWARNVFIASIIYLPILFCVMVVNGKL
jgi:heme o synthase